MHSDLAVKRLPLGAILTVCFFLCTAASASAKQDKVVSGTADQSQYVGSESCKGCHEDQFNNIAATKHRQINQLKTRLVGGEPGHGCESCHGPGAAHVNAGGDKTKIFTFKGASEEQVMKRCEGCHKNNQDHQNFQMSSHFENGVGCISCHSPHHAKQQNFLLKERQIDLCYSCHSDTRADFEQPFHHRVNEGLVKCADCHNVHGSNIEHQLRTGAQQDAACFKCHSEKRGPFVFEHPPVKTEGCTACHTPHGSTNPRLLNVAEVNALCLQCHSDIIAGPHPQNTRAQACTYCHTQIHGSNASSVFFK